MSKYITNVQRLTKCLRRGVADSFGHGGTDGTRLTGVIRVLERPTNWTDKQQNETS